MALWLALPSTELVVPLWPVVEPPPAPVVEVAETVEPELPVVVEVLGAPVLASPLPDVAGAVVLLVAVACAPVAFDDVATLLSDVALVLVCGGTAAGATGSASEQAHSVSMGNTWNVRNRIA